ncbi:oxygenase MpaB family protein [Frondihabitans australicus]|uniref:Uncharacterized protein (DUF2236 family) n=1 Tax=Frondihabitans australicus TaxID=386892 RepID=A0A495IJV2_9MICO|nr:oxygenase MpaB family protein [Frondihabitans australicus]RKR76069.1 uncharacterized protein (DUF2236 family) [Frondihabitans australicus]
MSPRIDPVAEGVILAGAGRAILLQLARPEVGYGVARHSDFARNPMGRLNGTLMYVYAVMTGSDADREFAAAFVSRMHTPVHGPGDDEAPAYDARDPGLQLWVAATLYDTALLVYRRALGNPPTSIEDELYRRYAALGTALDVPSEAWPQDREAFSAYWRSASQSLHVDPAIRAQADELWRATAAPWWVRRLMPLNRFVTAGLLPPDVRDGFGLSWSPRRQRRFDRLWTVVAAVYPRLPAVVRTAPQRYYLGRLRALRRRAPGTG